MLHKASWFGLKSCTRIDASSHHVLSNAHSCSTVIIKSVLLKTSELPTKKRGGGGGEVYPYMNQIICEPHGMLFSTPTIHFSYWKHQTQMEKSFLLLNYNVVARLSNIEHRRTASGSAFTALLTLCMDTIPIQWWISPRNEIEPINCWKHNAYLPISWTLQSLQKRCM